MNFIRTAANLDQKGFFVDADLCTKISQSRPKKIKYINDAEFLSKYFMISSGFNSKNSLFLFIL